MIELLIVVGLIGVISAIAIPQMAGLMGFLKLDGDARNLKNTVSLARMQAASNFSETRLFLDTSTNGFHVETLAPTAGAVWSVTSGTTYLSASNESYSFGSVAAAPPNTQSPIAQPPACINPATNTAIANSRCIVFNSRGIPIDSTGAPTASDAVYLTDGSNVYGLTISATSTIKLWKTPAQAAPSWVQQ